MFIRQLITTKNINKPAIFEVVLSSANLFVVHDYGHISSVTNEITNVIQKCINLGFEPEKQRLFYRDTTGRYDGVAVKKMVILWDFLHLLSQHVLASTFRKQQENVSVAA